MSNGIKPCPFCGKEGKYDEYWGLIECEQFSCGARVDADVDAWNTRPIEDALQARIEEQIADRKRIAGAYIELLVFIEEHGGTLLHHKKYGDMTRQLTDLITSDMED